MLSHPLKMCLTSPHGMVNNSIGMILVLIPKGTFQMGSPAREAGSRDNEGQHEVTLTQDYYLGAFEVTQAQYKKVMGKNPSYFQGESVAERHPMTGRVVKEVDSANHPVDMVSWKEAVKFCEKLSALPEERKAGRKYRLPIEAEWEYACRVGSTTEFSFGDDPGQLSNYAWFGENSKGQTHPVGEKKPNALGLYDMEGNVFEWCSDWYGKYPKSPITDPTGPETGSNRVVRGGSWDCRAASCRSAYRFGDEPFGRSFILGFRVVLGSN